ncbi:hypothetical protein LWH94_17540 [Marinobacter sp. G11]|uniref:hypothetical protein n=1 Tax=Marinobacter sp. G11 TaxID=2903522 RepID=UPI001E57AFFC|nr:hypothetical protein [Marinobacter sp. G11]MCE0760986.1 hypothetical protein [Marinobacter sp. G11]
MFYPTSICDKKPVEEGRDLEIQHRVRSVASALAFVMLFFTSVVSAFEDLPETSIEKTYQQRLENGLYSMFLKRGMLEKLMSEEGHNLERADEELQKISRGIAVCTVLGTRLLPMDIKKRLGVLIGEGLSASEITNQTNLLFEDRMRANPDDEDFLNAVEAQVELSEQCISAWMEPPIPDP